MNAFNFSSPVLEARRSTYSTHSLDVHLLTIFESLFSEMFWPFKASFKFLTEPPLEGEKDFMNGLGRMKRWPSSGWCPYMVKKIRY